MDPIALACSVQLELDPLLRQMPAAELCGTASLAYWEGELNGRPVLGLATGMGKTNAARALTALLERRRIAGVVGFGVGGAYLNSGLTVGAVAIATSECYGDEGVETSTGWISCGDIGIPLLVDPDGQDLYNEIPVDRMARTTAVDALSAEGRQVEIGPFVTVSTCSGTAARGARLETRFGAICESMEGAAFAHVAAIYRIPFLGIRGISNLVEDRDLSRWRLTEGAEAVAAALPVLAGAWPYPNRPGPHRTGT